MKLFIFVVFALIACVLARPQPDTDVAGQGQAAAGFATGAAPAASGRAVGLASGGPKDAAADIKLELIKNLTG